jgi:hypothetical protein
MICEDPGPGARSRDGGPYDLSQKIRKTIVLTGSGLESMAACGILWRPVAPWGTGVLGPTVKRLQSEGL